MKFTLVIKEKVKQIVLTPETAGEKKMLEVFDPLNTKREVELYSGQYEIDNCNAGFQRQFDRNNSVIILIKDDAAASEDENSQ